MGRSRMPRILGLPKEWTAEASRWPSAFAQGPKDPFSPPGANTAVGMAPSSGRDVQLQHGPPSPTTGSGKTEWNGMLSSLTSSRRSSSRMKA